MKRGAMKRSVVGSVAVWIGAVILACLVGFLGYLAWTEKKDREAPEEAIGTSLKRVAVIDLPGFGRTSVRLPHN